MVTVPLIFKAFYPMIYILYATAATIAVSHGKIRDRIDRYQ